MVYYRWGRVGVKGQDKLNGPYTSQQAAVSEFEKKFYDKTKNRWWNRKKFFSHPRSYTWLEMDYSETKNEPTVSCLMQILCFSIFCLRIAHLHRSRSFSLFYVKPMQG